MQNEDSSFEGGANDPCLIQARKTFKALGHQNSGWFSMSENPCGKNYVGLVKQLYNG